MDKKAANRIRVLRNIQQENLGNPGETLATILRMFLSGEISVEIESGPESNHFSVTYHSK